jgi:hypothetical protein
MAPEADHWHDERRAAGGEGSVAAIARTGVGAPHDTACLQQSCDLAVRADAPQPGIPQAWRAERWYRELRDRFGLSAQPAIRVIAKVADAYATLRANVRAGNYGGPGSKRRRKIEATPIRFRPDAAQPFDARCLSWQLPESGRDGTVSIWTTARRMRDVRLVGDPTHLSTLREAKIGETDLIRRDGQWQPHAVIDLPDVPVQEPENGFLGVDPGIVNIATTSDGQRSSGTQRAGIAFVQVDPACTSQICHACGYVDRKNRRSQASFICGRCDVVGAHRPQRGMQCGLLGRSHASRRGAHPGSRPRRQQQTYRYPCDWGPSVTLPLQASP